MKIKIKNKKAILEATKELARYLLFGLIALAVAWVEAEVAGGDPESVQVIIGTLALRFADKYVHENENTKVNGISPF